MRDCIYEGFVIFIVLNFNESRSKSIFLKLQVLLLLLLSHPIYFTLSTFVTVIFRTVVDLYKMYLRSVGGRLCVTSAALSSLSGSESSHTAQIQSSTFKDQSLVGLLQKSGPPDQALCWATPSSSILPILLCHLLHILPSQGQELEQSKEVGIRLTSSLSKKTLPYMQQDFQEVWGAVLVEGGQGKVLQPECAISQQALSTKGHLKSCHQVVVSTFGNGYHGHSSPLTCSHLNDKLGVTPISEIHILS